MVEPGYEPRCPEPRAGTVIHPHDTAPEAEEPCFLKRSPWLSNRQSRVMISETAELAPCSDFLHVDIEEPCTVKITSGRSERETAGGII